MWQYGFLSSYLKMKHVFPANPPDSIFPIFGLLKNLKCEKPLRGRFPKCQLSQASENGPEPAGSSAAADKEHHEAIPPRSLLDPGHSVPR